MSKIDELADKIAKTIKNPDEKPKPTPYDTKAEVVRTDGETAWVKIPGGVDETPVRKTIDCKEGDSVQVRVAGGSAWLTGNQTAPPTDDTAANTAIHLTNIAQQAADDAQDSADEALVKIEKLDDSFKLQIGNLEEDVGSKIEILQDSISTKVGNDEFSSEITQLQDSINTKVGDDEFSSEITQLQDSISTKVGTEELNTRITQTQNSLTIEINNAKETAEDASSAANNAQSTANSAQTAASNALGTAAAASTMATNYIKADGNGIKVCYDEDNYTHIGSDRFSIMYEGSEVYRTDSDETILGDNSSMQLILDSQGLRFRMSSISYPGISGIYDGSKTYLGFPANIVYLQGGQNQYGTYVNFSGVQADGSLISTGTDGNSVKLACTDYVKKYVANAVTSGGGT